MEEENEMNLPKPQTDIDIVMEGYLLYRIESDQLELEGNWCMSNDETKERFSYLHLKDKPHINCPIHLSEVYYSDTYDANYSQSFTNNLRNVYNLNISSSNIIEAILIPHGGIFNTVLNFLSSEYHGYFLYFKKTIEDRFGLNFSYENNQIRIDGMILYYFR